MNSKFERLLASNSWEIQPGTAWHTVYRKSYPVEFSGNKQDVLIDVYFSNFNTDEFPNLATFNFVMTTPITPGKENRRTRVKGASRIVAMLELMGYMTAIKYAAFAHPIKYYKQHAKVALNKTNVL